MTQWFKQAGVPLRRPQFALRADDKAAYLGALKAGAGIGFAASYLRAVRPDLPLPQSLKTHREIASNRLIKAVYEGLAMQVTQRLR